MKLHPDSRVVLLRLLRGDGLRWLKIDDHYSFRRGPPDPMKARVVWPLIRAGYVRARQTLRKSDPVRHLSLTREGRKLAEQLRAIEQRAYGSATKNRRGGP